MNMQPIQGLLALWQEILFNLTARNHSIDVRRLKAQAINVLTWL